MAQQMIKIDGLMIYSHGESVFVRNTTMHNFSVMASSLDMEGNIEHFDLGPCQERLVMGVPSKSYSLSIGKWERMTFWEMICHMINRKKNLVYQRKWMIVRREIPVEVIF